MKLLGDYIQGPKIGFWFTKKILRQTLDFEVIRHSFNSTCTHPPTQTDPHIMCNHVYIYINIHIFTQIHMSSSYDLDIVRPQTSVGIWLSPNCVYSTCGQAVGPADPERYMHLHAA